MPSDQNYAQEWENIMDFLAESVADAPDEEILEEALAEGADPDPASEKVRNILRQGSLSYRQALREKLTQEAEAEKGQKFQASYRLPSTREERLTLLQRILNLFPYLKDGALTYQCREYTKLSDADLENCLNLMGDLGILDKLQYMENQ